MSEARERRRVVALVALAFLLRAGFAIVVPPLQAPDEKAHFDYVRFLVDERKLPVQPPPTSFEAFNDHQSYQPPLAYLAMAPTYAVARALGAGRVGALRALRLQNALLGALLVWIAWGVAARLSAPGDPLRLLAPGLLALLPGLAANAGSVNNDTTAHLATAALWWVWLRDPPGRRRGVRLGLVLGAACLSKLTAGALAPLLLLVPWLRDRALRPALTEALWAGGVALLVLAPWMARNVAVYGSPLALDAGSVAFADLAGVLPPDVLREASTPAPGKALLQVFGRFGITNNLSSWIVPAAWLPLAALAVAGGLRRTTFAQRAGLDGYAPCLALALLLATIGLVSFSLRYYGAWQGRYLYTAALPIGLLLAAGAARWFHGGRERLGPALLLGVLAAADALLLLRLQAFFANVPRGEWGLRTLL